MASMTTPCQGFAAVGKREAEVFGDGRPDAILISPEELASLGDTLELLSDRDAMTQLDESRRAYAAGDFQTGDKLRSRYLAK